MEQMTVLFVDSTHPLLPEKLSSAGFTIMYKPGISLDEYLELLPSLHGIIIRSRFILNKSTLQGGVNLKFIGRVGSGMENIDLKYCDENGIRYFSSPEGNRQAVAEHCLGLLLNLSKKITKANTEIQHNTWDREGNRGFEISGKTIGIIGYGNTGSAFGKVLRGFDIKVLAYDKYKSGYSQENIIEVTMDELYQECDIISLHVPYTEETHYLADETFLRRFRKNIILLNTSRGSVVKTTAIASGLQSGKILGAGLDVLEYEDYSFEGFFKKPLPEAFEQLRQHSGVILTPHVGGWTKESNVKLSVILAEKIINTFCS